MQFKLFVLSCMGDSGAEEEMNRFLRSHRVVSVTKELVNLSEGLCWSFCVEYLAEGGAGKGAAPHGQRSERKDYKKVLSEDDFALFSAVRDLRRELAQSAAVPVYAVLNNEQLAQLAQNRPATLEDFQKTAGIGDSKAREYGEAFLNCIRDFSRGEAPAENAENGAEEKREE